MKLLSFDAGMVMAVIAGGFFIFKHLTIREALEKAAAIKSWGIYSELDDEDGLKKQRGPLGDYS